MANKNNSMKKIILSIATIFSFVPAFAQENETKPSGEASSLHSNPEVYDFFTKGSSYSANVSDYSVLPVRKHFGLSMYMLVEEDRDSLTSGAEALVGPTYLSKYFEVGILGGIEVNKKLWRYSPWFLVRSKDDKFTSLFVYEQGASGEGIRVETWYKVAKLGKWEMRCGGIVHRPHYGPGIKLGYKKSYLYSAPYMWSWDDKEPSVAVIGAGIEL